MSHPNSETLTDFMYEELSPERQAEVNAHVQSCGECSAQVEAWRGVRRELKGWTLPPKTRRAIKPAFAAPALKWAAAAAVFIGTGFGIAKLTAAPADLSPLRADLARELRQEVRQELAAKLASYSEDQTARQQEFQQAIVQAMTRLETRRVADHASLRKDVETVAIRAQEEFDRILLVEHATPQGGTIDQ